MKGIGPSSEAWEATALPLSYTRNLTKLYVLLKSYASPLAHGGWDPASSNPKPFLSHGLFWFAYPPLEHPHGRAELWLFYRRDDASH